MKILLMRIDRLGDLILTLPAISAIQKAYPHARIEMLVNQPYKEFIAAIPEITTIHTIDTYHWTASKVGKLLYELRKQEYDLAINLLPRTHHLSSLILFFVRAKEKAGYSVGLQKYYLTKKVPPVTKLKFERELVFDILRNIGINAVDTKIELPFGQEPQEMMKKKEKIIVIHPATASDWRRHWPLSSYQRLVELLTKTEKDISIIFTGTAEEKKDIEKVIFGITYGSKRIKNIAGETTIKELCALVRNAAIIISPLTSITHIAVAMGKPAIALVGPTPIERWTTQDLPYYVIKKDFPCSPCEHKKGCIYGKENKCMHAITPEEVYEKSIFLLKQQEKVS